MEEDKKILLEEEIIRIICSYSSIEKKEIQEESDVCLERC